MAWQGSKQIRATGGLGLTREQLAEVTARRLAQENPSG
jgi:hypothetical protein